MSSEPFDPRERALRDAANAADERYFEEAVARLTQWDPDVEITLRHGVPVALDVAEVIAEYPTRRRRPFPRRS